MAVSKTATVAGTLYYGTRGQVDARRAARAGRPDLIDLGVAESFPTLRAVLEAEGGVAAAAGAVHAATMDGSHAQYGEYSGSAPLRAAVARVMSDNVLRGREPATADEVVVTAGATAALEALAFALCNEGDALLVPAPLYPAFHVDVGMRAGVAV